MAFEEIISAIDVYIAQLEEAKKLLSYSLGSDVRHKQEPTKAGKRKKPQDLMSEDASVAASLLSPVPIHVLPPKLPRQVRTRLKVVPPNASAPKTSIPQGLIVVRRSDSAQKHLTQAGENTLRESAPRQSVTVPFNELAQEVKRRLAASHR